MKINKNGFTLIEIIATMVCVGIISALAGAGIVYIVEGFVFHKEVGEAVQKGQLVMSKIVKELGAMTSVTTANETSINYIRDAAPHSISLNDQNILFDGDILTDDVSSFKFKYYNLHNSTATGYSNTTGIIEILLGLAVTDDIDKTFENRVYVGK
jgi:prepilin-type N-terminal cleavage/methylation domain-containing protein